MKHKQLFIISLFIISVIVVCYVGISIYLILDQTSEIELLKSEKYNYMRKVKQLEDMIISIKNRGKIPLLPAEKHAYKEEYSAVKLKSKELETASVDFLNMQQYIPDFLPTANFILTKPYLPSKSHFGIDLAGKLGNPIFASASGIIETTEKKDEIFGKSILIDHLNGYKTFYGHNSKILVQENFFVKKGEIIAELGNTGKSSAPHLHFEILFDGENINPESIIKK